MQALQAIHQDIVGHPFVPPVEEPKPDPFEPVEVMQGEPVPVPEPVATEGTRVQQSARAGTHERSRCAGHQSRRHHLTRRRPLRWRTKLATTTTEPHRVA
jgi:hypothetical protein